MILDDRMHLAILGCGVLVEWNSGEISGGTINGLTSRSILLDTTWHSFEDMQRIEITRGKT